jgi:hypothetical protein
MSSFLFAFRNCTGATSTYNDFDAVNAQALKGTTLKFLQDYLFNASLTDLEKLSSYFLNGASLANKEDQEFATLMRDIQINSKDAVNAYTAFNRKYPNSKYQYLIKIKAQ